MQRSLIAMGVAALAAWAPLGSTTRGSPSHLSAPPAGLKAALGGNVHGHVVNAAGVGIPGAQLQMMHLTGERSDDRNAVSDDAGAFAFVNLAAGIYELSVRRIGFKPEFTQVEVANGGDVSLNVRLTSAVQQLDTVRAEANTMPEQYGRSLRMAEFYERRRLGNGHFFTREDIEASAASSSASLINRVGGMRADVNHTDIIVHSMGCAGTGVSSGADTSTMSRNDGWGHIALRVDGSKIPPGDRASVMGMLSPADIEAIEVYRSPGELPPQDVGDACAAVYVWTRIGASK
jgi:hypothetical protein